MTATASAMIPPHPCEAAGCKRTAFGSRFCMLHQAALEPAGQTDGCRAPECPLPPWASGLCQAHYARWNRWRRRVAEGGREDVEEWLARDWARPIGRAVLLTRLSTRMLTELYDRLEGSCKDGETVYDVARRALEAYAQGLPQVTGEQARALKARRRRSRRK